MKNHSKAPQKSLKKVAEGESLKIVSDFFFFVQKLTSIRIDLLLEGTQTSSIGWS